MDCIPKTREQLPPKRTSLPSPAVSKCVLCTYSSAPLSLEYAGRMLMAEPSFVVSQDAVSRSSGARPKLHPHRGRAGVRLQHLPCGGQRRQRLQRRAACLGHPRGICRPRQLTGPGKTAQRLLLLVVGDFTGPLCMLEGVVAMTVARKGV